ncbi:MAG: hypothetical protein ACFFB3_04525 [Candidatus Hodarchaeota archaeon]
MSPPLLSRNRLTGFLFGFYNLDKEVKGLLNEDEQYISGYQIVQFNESYYILGIFYIIIATVLAVLYSLFFLLLLLVVPVFILFSYELELVFLTNDRLIIVKRRVLERLFRIQDETSIKLDQIVILSYSRAPLNRNALYACFLGVILIIAFVPADEILALPSYLPILVFFLLFFPLLYLFWQGLRLTKRSVELYIIGVPQPYGVGRTKGIPLWFVYDIQNLVLGFVHSSLQLLTQKEKQLLNERDRYYEPIKEIIHAFPDEEQVQKEMLLLLNEKRRSKKELMKKTPTYSKNEFDRHFKALRKKRMIFFDKTTKTWAINRTLMIGTLKPSKKQPDIERKEIRPVQIADSSGPGPNEVTKAEEVKIEVPKRDEVQIKEKITLNDTLLEKKILDLLSSQNKTKKELIDALSTSETEFNRAFERLQKKQQIHFNRTTKTWGIHEGQMSQLDN